METKVFTVYFFKWMSKLWNILLLTFSWTCFRNGLLCGRDKVWCKKSASNLEETFWDEKFIFKNNWLGCF